MRILIGGLSHETNTFADDYTGLTDLSQFTVFRGHEIIDAFSGTKSGLGGMLAAAELIGAHVNPALYAVAEPSGTIESATYESLKHELLAMISEAGQIDAVVLELHGAGVAERVEDLEGDLVSAVRRLVGAATPIVASLDLHGNLTQNMVDHIDLMLGVHFYPHTDCYERGMEVVTALPSLLDGSLRPVTRLVQLPMLLPWSWTETEPARSVNELCWNLEIERQLVDCTFFHGFPMADVAAAGSSVVATTNDDPPLAGEVAEMVARFAWERREAFLRPLETPEQGVRRAATISLRSHPVVINDSADNPGAGSPGDGTHLLKALLEQRPSGACFGYIFDPAVATQAHTSGAGSTIEIDLGGKCGELQGETLHLRVYVKSLTDGVFIHSGPVETGVRADLGPMARLQADGVDIIVGSRRQQTLDPALFLLHGIDVAEYSIVALKSSVHFRAGFAEIASAIISVDSPGLSTQQIALFPRRHASRPLWPLDESAIF